MTGAMRAVVLTEPGPVENLQIQELPIPRPRPGWVRIAVQAFGLNRSEHHLRIGLAEGVRYPIVPGIEAVGVVDAAPGSDLRPGQQVAALMGGMGRAYDGGYAEYTVVPRGSVIPFHSTLPWDVLGAVPETLQTTYGSLTTGLDLRPGQSLLIRGGTSALGFATAAVAHDMGATVLATTRQPGRLDSLAAHGVDHPILDGIGEGTFNLGRHYLPDGSDPRRPPRRGNQHCQRKGRGPHQPQPRRGILMHAAWYDRKGDPREVLAVGDLPDLEPGPGEVRIRISASGINPGDVGKRMGPPGAPMPFPRVIPHSDGAGVIDARHQHRYVRRRPAGLGRRLRAGQHDAAGRRLDRDIGCQHDRAQRDGQPPDHPPRQPAGTGDRGHPRLHCRLRRVGGAARTWLHPGDRPAAV
jgi:NADPH:quinone reductase-like Zn-dependent oxidoreductase